MRERQHFQFGMVLVIWVLGCLGDPLDPVTAWLVHVLAGSFLSRCTSISRIGQLPRILPTNRHPNLNETDYKNKNIYVANLKQEHWLGLFAFSYDFGTAGYPSVPCYVCCSKHRV